MEALRPAASVIGVISLALQLVTFQDIILFLEAAPEEIQRLTHSLAELKDVPQDVRSVAEMQQLLSDIPVSSVDGAFKGCQKEISFLEAALTKLHMGHGSPRAFVRRKWKPLKFVIKEKGIEEFKERVQSSMRRLNLSLLANTAKICLSTHIQVLANPRSSTSTQSPNLSQDQVARVGPRLMSRSIAQRSLRYGLLVLPRVRANWLQTTCLRGRRQNPQSELKRRFQFHCGSYNTLLPLNFNHRVDAGNTVQPYTTWLIGLLVPSGKCAWLGILQVCKNFSQKGLALRSSETKLESLYYM